MAVKSLQGGLFRSPDGEVPLVGGFGLVVPVGRPGEAERSEAGEGDLDALVFLVLRSLPVALGVRFFAEGCPPPSVLVAVESLGFLPPDLGGCGNGQFFPRLHFPDLAQFQQLPRGFESFSSAA